MEGITLPEQQNAYGIGSVLVGWAVEKRRMRDMGLTFKIFFFLFKINKSNLR